MSEKFDLASAEDHSFSKDEPLIVETEILGIKCRFICTSDRDWVVPVVDISKALGIPRQTQSDVLKRNKKEFKEFLTHVRVTRTSEQVAEINVPCLTRDGITMYLMKLTPSRMSDPDAADKISEFQIAVVKAYGEHLDHIKIPRWWLRREAVKLKYKGMTDAIRDHLISDIPDDKKWLVYATEADMLNMVVFGKTAKQAGCNQRDTASKTQLEFLEKLEEQNDGFIRLKFGMPIRYEMLCKIRDDMINKGRYLPDGEEQVEISKVPRYIEYN